MRHFLMLLILCSGFNLYAQDKPKQWEIGVDLLPLLDKNNLPEKSFFVRYHLKDKNRAWRLRGGFDRNPISHYYPTLDVLEPYYLKMLDENPLDKTWYLRPGMEWHLKTTPHSVFYVGGDIHLLYAYNKYGYDIGRKDNDFKIRQRVEYQVLKTGLAGFAGVSYFPYNWLSLSIESSLELFYLDMKDKLFNVSEYEKRLFGVGTHNRFIFDCHPILVFNLSFHF